MLSRMGASFARTASLGTLVVALFGAGGCTKPVECTAEVTEGAGTYRASVRTTDPEAKARRSALEQACEKLCRAKARDGEPEPNVTGCAGRCAVDVQAGKIGGRVRCER
ncbi:MAG: hypothetical protein FJ095_00615 [Deltaproteobacteria bacterium]|nr:hypothetical protein [Deltaproteobacteria bacterium]